MKLQLQHLLLPRFTIIRYIWFHWLLFLYFNRNIFKNQWTTYTSLTCWTLWHFRRIGRWYLCFFNMKKRRGSIGAEFVGQWLVFLLYILLLWFYLIYSLFMQFYCLLQLLELTLLVFILKSILFSLWKWRLIKLHQLLIANLLLIIFSKISEDLNFFNQSLPFYITFINLLL